MRDPAGRRRACLKPVDGAAVDEAGVLPQALTEGRADRAQAERHVQVPPALRDEERPRLHPRAALAAYTVWPARTRHHSMQTSAARVCMSAPAPASACPRARRPRGRAPGPARRQASARGARPAARLVRTAPHWQVARGGMPSASPASSCRERPRLGALVGREEVGHLAAVQQVVQVLHACLVLDLPAARAACSQRDWHVSAAASAVSWRGCAMTVRGL